MNTRTSLGDLILLTLEKTIDGYVRLEDFTYNQKAYFEGYHRIIKKSSLSQALKRLREKGLVDFIDEGELILRLTDTGRDQAVWEKIKLGNENWDGRWRIVIWDIPEKRHKTRDLLRLKLKYWGFERWQDSVWVTKANCTNELRNFIKQVGIEKWVKVLESDNVD